MMVDVLSGSFDTAIVLLQLAVGDDGKTGMLTPELLVRGKKIPE